MLPGVPILRVILFCRRTPQCTVFYCSLLTTVLFCHHFVLLHPMPGGLSGSGHSAPEVKFLASVPEDTLSFIHLYVSVPDSVQLSQRQWAQLKPKVQSSLYNKSGNIQNKNKAFAFAGETIQKAQAPFQLQAQRHRRVKDSQSMALLTSVMPACLWYFHTHCPWWPDSRPHDPAPLPDCDWTWSGHLTLMSWRVPACDLLPG